MNKLSYKTYLGNNSLGMQSHSRRNQPHLTWNSSSNWHSLSPERRPLKRHKTTLGGHLNHPDVYPQDPMQEEDKMTIERLQRGYQAVALPMEYDSVIKRSLLNCQEEIAKNAKWLMQIIQKKNELNVINLDKKRIKECTFQKFDTNTNSKSIQDFFSSFTTGRRELHQLARRFPCFTKKEECLEYLYSYKVPIQRVLWFFKMMQFGHHNTTNAQNKQKRSSVEQYAVDQTKLFSKFIREFFRICDNSTQLESSPAYQRWPYFSCILKHAFEEGIVDRQDFLTDVCDIANEYVNFSFEKPQIFRMIIIFLSQFVDVITQNAMLSRRVAYLIVTRFKLYKRDYDRKRGASSTNIYASECFGDLTNCRHHRAVVMTMLGLLHAIIIDCPVALVWNSFESGELRCGSPLDMLPCSPEVFTQHLPKSAARISKLLQWRIAEIKFRSQRVENRWMLNSTLHSGFELIVDVCLNVISVLDKAVLNAPNAITCLYRDVFCVDISEKVSPDLLVRILLQWAVTTEREGTHRALIVCKLLWLRKRHYRGTAFGASSLQDILVEYLSRESPTPASSGVNFYEEFKNLMHLFFELQRFQLFNHDAYLKTLMRCGQFSYKEPILKKLLGFMKPSVQFNNCQAAQRTPVSISAQNTSRNFLSNSGGSISQVPLSQVQSSSQQSSMENFTSRSEADPAIISFIPTLSTFPNSASSSLSTLPPVSSISTSNFINANSFSATSVTTSALPNLPTLTSSLSSSSLLGGVGDSPCMSTPGRETPSANNLAANNAKESSVLKKTASLQHAFIFAPKEITIHERFFIHLPVEQTEERRDTCNQRSIILYGISDERDAAYQEIQKIAGQICRIWQKKVHVEYFENSKKVRFKCRFTAEQFAECLAKFKSQTYYDQLVITGWCIRNFIDMISDFIQCCSLILPTTESLEIICFMLATCQNYHGILSLSIELLSHLILLEKFLLSFESECIPGTISTQMAYVLVGYFAENFYYFLHSAEAITILNGLYRLIEKELCAEGYPVSGWARAVAAFVFHAKNELLNANLCLSGQLLGNVDAFRKIFPKSGAEKEPQELRYNPHLFIDLLQESRRFYFYHDYKRRLPSIEDAHTQYSFVVNAFIVAKNAKQDFLKLAELSNICGHISAEKSLAGTWCVAIQELCYTETNKNGYSHLINEINIKDSATRHTISTFVLLLASKYCFSSHALITRLLNNVLIPFIKTEHTNFNGFEMGLCLALEIIAGIVCGTDSVLSNSEMEPSVAGLNQPNANGTASGNNLYESSNVFTKKIFERSADERALRIIQIRELDACIFPFLSAVCILTDTVKRKLNASNGTNHNLKQVLEVLKCSFLAMCEQEWVIERVFRICETADMEPFNCNALKHNSVGQQLLRIVLRRKSERTIKQQLMVCNGNSKKSLLDKLLSAMTLWNMRATYYDLKLMIKEVSPDGTQKHAPQQQAYMDALICEIGKCCRDLFLNCRVENYHLLAQPSQSIATFRFNQVNCYWLISPLVSVCPKPDNIPQSFSGQVTVKAKFLKEAAAMLDTSHDNSTERLKQSARLLSQQPFLNLILTCVQGEELDNLVNSLLRHIQLIINKSKENPTLVHQTFFALEREGLLLRLNLVGGIFDFLLSSTSTSEPWAIAFFQLMFYEIITADRDKEYFGICYDMLSTIVHSMMVSSTPSAQGDSEKRSESRARFPAYNSFVKKIRKELGDRTIPPDLNCLAQLLPISKSMTEMNAWESFSMNSPQKNASASSKMTTSAQQYLGVRIDKQPQYMQRHLMRLLHHAHYIDVPSPGIFGQQSLTAVGSDLPVDVFLAAPSLECVNADMYMSPHIVPPAESPSVVNASPTLETGGAIVTSDDSEQTAAIGVIGNTVQSCSTTRIFDKISHEQFTMDHSSSHHIQAAYSSVASTSSLNTSSTSNITSTEQPGVFFPQYLTFGELSEKGNHLGNMMHGFGTTQHFVSNSVQNPAIQAGMSGILARNQQQQSVMLPGNGSSNVPLTPPIMLKSEASSLKTINAVSSSTTSQHQQFVTVSAQQQSHIPTDPATTMQTRIFGGVTNAPPSVLSNAAAMNVVGSSNMGMGVMGSTVGGLHHPAMPVMPSNSIAAMRMDAMSSIAQPPGQSGIMHPMAAHAAAVAAAGFLPDNTSRSGSSTPIVATGTVGESTRTSSNRRRKNAAGTNNTPTAPNQSQIRVPKRKKESKQSQQLQVQQQQQLHSQNPIMVAGMNVGTPMMGGINSMHSGPSTSGSMGTLIPGPSSAGMDSACVSVGGPVQMPGVIQQMQQQMASGMGPQVMQHQQFVAWQQQQAMLQRSKKQQTQQQPQQPMHGMLANNGGSSRFLGDHTAGIMGGNAMTPSHLIGGQPMGSSLAMMGGGAGMYSTGMPSSSSGISLHSSQSATLNDSKHNLQQKLLQRINNQQHQQN